MYKVIKYFTDLQDNGYAYHVGDTYPREGLAPSDERIESLLSGQNKRKAKFIEEVKEEPQRAAKRASETPKKSTKVNESQRKSTRKSTKSHIKSNDQKTTEKG